MKTKRIEVTLRITIPHEWTIGETEEFIEKHLIDAAVARGLIRGWNPRVEVGMQRSTRPRKTNNDV